MRALGPAPQRLSSEEYRLRQSSPIRIYHQFAREPVSVHWHEFYEIHVILAGEGTHLLNGTAHQLCPGTLFLLTPTDFHAVLPHPERPLELFNIIFTEELLSAELLHLLFATPGELCVQVQGVARTAVESACALLWTEAEQQQSGYGLIMRGALERLLIDLMRNAVPTSPPLFVPGEHSIQAAIRLALIYLQHHFREPLSLAAVARQVGFSSHYFSECFHQVTGLTFQRYLQDLRMRFAHKLLAASSLPITTICSSAGFNSLTHFERVFKERFGLSPRAYQQCCAEEGRSTTDHRVYLPCGLSWEILWIASYSVQSRTWS